MHYFQFNIGDYTRDTAHLSDMEDLAYRRMLDLYYKLEGPLPKDEVEIARLVRMRSHSDCIAIVLREFFVCTDEGYRNHRADKELAGIYSKSESARKAANARWNKNKHLDDANALRTLCGNYATQDTSHNTQHTEHKEVKKKTVSPSLDYSCWPSMPNDELFAEWKELRKRKKAAISQTVINRVGKELHKAASSGFTVDQCFEQWVYKGWSGFEAEWMSNSGIKKQSQMQPITGITYQEMDL